MNTGIPSEHLEKICQILRKDKRIEDAVLFGSRAIGTQRLGSDIDIALKGKGIDARLLAVIERDYDALYLPWKLDLIVYDTIESPDLKDHIDQVGISLGKKN